jgi:hypothetical protein
MLVLPMTSPLLTSNFGTNITATADANLPYDTTGTPHHRPHHPSSTATTPSFLSQAVGKKKSVLASVYRWRRKKTLVHEPDADKRFRFTNLHETALVFLLSFPGPYGPCLK